MLTLLVLTGGPFTPSRAWWAGMASGAAFCVSMKSSLMVASLGCGGLALLVLQRPRWQIPVGGGLAFVAGALIPPALVALYFVSHGAGREFYQGVIGHNLMGRTMSSKRWHRAVVHWREAEAVALLAAFGLSRLVAPGRARPAIFFLAVTAASYFTLLEGFWPILTAEDYLPLFPAVFAAVAPVAVSCAGAASAGGCASGFARLRRNGLPSGHALSGEG
jgi:hypothetical protein